jgi:hypothetical protein
MAAHKKKGHEFSEKGILWSSPSGTMREGMTQAGCPICLLPCLNIMLCFSLQVMTSLLTSHFSLVWFGWYNKPDVFVEVLIRDEIFVYA